MYSDVQKSNYTAKNSVETLVTWDVFHISEVYMTTQTCVMSPEVFFF